MDAVARGCPGIPLQTNAADEKAKLDRGNWGYLKIEMRGGEDGAAFEGGDDVEITWAILSVSA